MKGMRKWCGGERPTPETVVPTTLQRRCNSLFWANRAVESYVAMRRAAGVAFRSKGGVLRSFAAFSEAAGKHYVCGETAVQWAGSARLVSTRARRLG